MNRFISCALYRFGGVLGLSKYLQNKEIQAASFLSFRTSRMRFTSLRQAPKMFFHLGIFKRTSTEKMFMSYIRRVKKPPYLGHNPIVFMFKMCETPCFFEFPVICRKKKHIFFMVHTHIISYLSHPKSIFGSSSQPFWETNARRTCPAWEPTNPSRLRCPRRCDTSCGAMDSLSHGIPSRDNGGFAKRFPNEQNRVFYGNP